VRLLQEGLGSLRGAIGSPEQVEDLVARYEAAGVDQVIFILQAGTNRHEHICESLELFAERVMPRFAEGREEREAKKAERLAEAVGAALGRREKPHKLTTPYLIDETAELARARRRRRRQPTPRQIAEVVLANTKRAARERAAAMLARVIDGADDAEIERRLGGGIVQRAMFTAMARSFEPDAAGGFHGRLVYELSRPATGSPPTSWTIAVSDGHAAASAGGTDDAALIVRFRLADFVRIAAGKMDPAAPLLENRASFEGDFALAARLPEMFGAPSPY